MKRDNMYGLALLSLFIAALTWGSAYVFMKENLAVFSPLWLLGLRFGIAGLLLNLVCIRRWKDMTRTLLRHGVWMGVLLYWEFYFFTVGIQYTTASRSAFVVAAYIIFVPAAYWLVRKKRPGRLDLAAAATCLAGTALILFDGSGGGINKGDILTAGCSAVYAVHVVYGSLYAKEEDPLLLNMVQIGTSGIIGLGAALLLNPFPQGIAPGDFKGVLYLAVIATICPYACSLFGQKYVRTTTSAIILSFESVFGCLASVVVLGERLSLRFIAGAAVVLLSFFVSEGLFFKGLKKPETK